MPLHINDDDLCPTTLRINANGHVTERPRSGFTMLSYTVHALQIAIFARESIDLRSPLCQAQGQEAANEGAKMRNHLNKRHEDFIAGLPSYFRLGSTVGNTSTGPIAAIPVQRWMLHQQLWSLFLRIHRASLSSQDGRTSCQLLAQNIISTQAQITSTVRRLRFSIHQRNPSVQCRHCAARRLATFTPAQGCRSFECPVDSADDERQDLGGYRNTADTERGGNFTLHTGSRSATNQSHCPPKHYCSRSLDEARGRRLRHQRRKQWRDLNRNPSERTRSKIPTATTQNPPLKNQNHQHPHNPPNPAPAASSTSPSPAPAPPATDGFPALDVLPLLANDPTLDFEHFFDLDYPPPPPPLHSPTESDGPFPGVAHAGFDTVGCADS